jgi:tRNA(fMet)-specific endonuclease VapC
LYLLDTNTVIYFFKGYGKVADMQLSKSPKEIALASINVYELEVGTAKSNRPEKRKKQLETLISRITVFPFALKEAKVAAKIRTELESRGTPIGPLDNLIAGTAICHNAVLVSRNTKEFNRIESLCVENWY